MTLERIEKATRGGARLEAACETLGISARTLQRWRRGGEDQRRGPKSRPANALSPAERATILEVVNEPEFRDLSPCQIVPLLADRGIYLASESTIYRILREEDLLEHRERSRAPSPRKKPREHVATGPNQVYSWDITYLKSPVPGEFFYLYLIMDVWSRKIIGAQVHERECSELAADLIESSCQDLGIDTSGIVLHSDNGSPMKGSTMLSTLQRLGVVPSFSRPQVSDDNAFSESLFRTLKYRPCYPSTAFESLPAAQDWVEGFTAWYNGEHLHSGIRYVTPDDRHFGREQAILENRHCVYETARRTHPDRWSGETRNWNPIEKVYLNPEKKVDNCEVN